MKKLLIISASVLISLGSLGYGAYYLGNTAYDDGLHQGISAVVHQCAQKHTTIYNGETGEVMVCDGSALTQPQETPEKALPEPSSPIPEPKQDSGIYQEPQKQSI